MQRLERLGPTEDGAAPPRVEANILGEVDDRPVNRRGRSDRDGIVRGRTGGDRRTMARTNFLLCWRGLPSPSTALSQRELGTRRGKPPRCESRSRSVTPRNASFGSSESSTSPTVVPQSITPASTRVAASVAVIDFVQDPTW